MVIFAQFQYPLKFLFVIEVWAWYICTLCKWLFDGFGDPCLFIIASCWVRLCRDWVTLGAHATAHRTEPGRQLIVTELWLHIIPVTHYLVDVLLLLLRRLTPHVPHHFRRIWSTYHLFHLIAISFSNIKIVGSSATHHSASCIASTCSTAAIHFVLELLSKHLAIVLFKIGLENHSLVFC